MKRCCACRSNLPLTHFHKDRSKKDGLCNRCKSCIKVYYETVFKSDSERVAKQRVRSKLWREKHPDRNRRAIRCATLRKKYGISAEEFDLLLASQNGRCAICGDSESKGHGAMHVDHDHDTGVIRGILCQACNVTLGKMRDRPELLRKAADYLEKTI